MPPAASKIVLQLSNGTAEDIENLRAPSDRLAALAEQYTAELESTQKLNRIMIGGLVSVGLTLVSIFFDIRRKNSRWIDILSA